MSERGVFAVDRGIFEHPIFAPEPFTEREAWLWMIGSAAWKETRTRVGHKVFKLERGQLVFSIRFMAEKWRWTPARVHRFVTRLKNDTMVITQTTRDATHITICNYDKYAFGRNSGDTPSETPNETLARHSRDKEEEGKELKKEDTSSLRSDVEARANAPRSQQRGSRLPADWRPSEADLGFAAARGLTGQDLRTEIEKFRNYWTAKSGRDAAKLDWPATWRNWVLRAMEGPGQRGPPHRRSGGFASLALELSETAHHDNFADSTSFDLDLRPG